MDKAQRVHQLEVALENGVTTLVLDFSEPQIKKILQYLELLQKWNKAYNLIATYDCQAILQQHVLDSLSIVNYIAGTNIIDIGTGAGLPGIPLAIALPKKQFTLLDSIGKKTRFLQQVKAELGLENVTVVESRAENFQPATCFDNVVSRAVTTASEMLALSQRLLCPGGKILLMKGPSAQDELTELGCQYEILPLTVPGLNKERCLVILSPA